MSSIRTTVKIIKNKLKNNISYSISRYEDGSFRSYNITGKLTSCENFISAEGTNYSEELIKIDCPTTIVITNEQQGLALINRCAEIFNKRAAEQDLNPAVDIKIESNAVRPTNTNILITNVEKLFVNSNTSLASNNTRIEDTLKALRSFSDAKTMITTNNQVQAARTGLQSALNAVKKSVKSYM